MRVDAAAASAAKPMPSAITFAYATPMLVLAFELMVFCNAILRLSYCCAQAEPLWLLLKIVGVGVVGAAFTGLVCACTCMGTTTATKLKQTPKQTTLRLNCAIDTLIDLTVMKTAPVF